MDPGSWRGGGSTVPVKPPLPRLHAITDERIARRDDLAKIARALSQAVGSDLALHARGHGLSGRELYTVARCFADQSPALLFVNDRLEIALACGAAGVQLAATSLTPDEARRLGSRWWIGRSVHTLNEARAARNAGADYLVAGPAYATPTHPDRAPLALATLQHIVGLGLPVVAIGGITPERASELRRLGVYGVAAIRAVWDARDPAEAGRALLETQHAAQ